jgi:hypothetical protein
MQIVHAGKMEWGENLASQRSGRMAHKLLFEGEENSPDNFILVLANEGSDYYSPRHRHAWDQVRFVLEGAVPIAKDMKIEAGEVGYFPEGVHYGPQEGGPDRVVLLLQFGGASGLGYLSTEQLRKGREDLLHEGVFADGVFRRRTGGEGKRNEDGYEAIWRKVTGTPIAYPKPCYRAPIVMRPDGFSSREISPGVSRRSLGTFPERGLSLEFLDFAADAHLNFDPSPARRLLFVREGEGNCNSQPYFPQTAIRLDPTESITISARSSTSVFVITVPLVGAPTSAS